MGIWNTRAMRFRVATAASAGMALALLAACGSDDADAAGSGGGGCDSLTEPIKIGNISPLSGPNAALGALNDNAAQIAIDVFNERNDICGQPIEQIRKDDKGDPATGLNAARELVSEGVTIMLNTGMAETEDALVPFLMQSGVIVVGNTGKPSLLDPETNPTFFSVFPSQAQYSAAVVDQIVAQGWDNVGILDDGTDWSQSHTEGLQEGLEEEGVSISDVVAYSPSAVDLSTPVQELKSAGAETMVLAGSTAVIPAVDALQQTAWEPNLISWGAYLAYLVPASDMPADLLEGCARSLPAAEAPDGTGAMNETTLAILEEGQQRLGDDPAVLHATTLYTQLLVVKEAVETAGSTESEDLKAAIESIENLPSTWPGVKLTFSEDNHTGYPDDAFSFCTLELGPYGIPYQNANVT